MGRESIMFHTGWMWVIRGALSVFFFRDDLYDHGKEAAGVNCANGMFAGLGKRRDLLVWQNHPKRPPRLNSGYEQANAKVAQ